MREREKIAISNKILDSCVKILILDKKHSNIISNLEDEICHAIKYSNNNKIKLKKKISKKNILNVLNYNITYYSLNKKLSNFSKIEHQTEMLIELKAMFNFIVNGKYSKNELKKYVKQVKQWESFLI